MKKRILLIGGVLLSIFVMLNIVWFAWRSIKYTPYTDALEQGEFSNILVPRYVYTDNDGYNYNVKYPEYLSLTGNLAVGTPVIGENLFTDALMIWPLVNGGYELGVLLYEEDNSYQIYIDSQGNALDSEYIKIVEKHRDNIDALLQKADEKWDIIQ